MSKRIKVHIYTDQSCETERGRWVGFRRLHELYELSDKKYLLTDNPDEADIILFGDIMEKAWSSKFLDNRLLKKYSHKSFSIAYHDPPYFYSHGMQNNNEKSIFTYGRIRTGSYTLHADRYGNPFIVSHHYSLQDYAQKEFLFTFIGRNSHKVREDIYKIKPLRQDILIEDSSHFKLWQGVEKGKRERQKYYYETLIRSKFSLCPRGSGSSSLRLFETMQLGIAPVIISDAWVPPLGPDWDRFSIIVKEKDVRDIEKIVESYEDRHIEMGQAAREAYYRYFADDVYFNYLLDNCVEIMKHQIVPETLCLMVTSFIFKSGNIMSRLKSRLSFRSRLKSLFQNIIQS